MLNWENVPPTDLLKRWAAIGIVAAAMDYDGVRPGGIETATNSINELVNCGCQLEIGSFRDNPVAVVCYDSFDLTVHVLPYVREHQLEWIALNHAVGQSRRLNGDYPKSFYAENQVIYEAALQLGFLRPEDEDYYTDEMLTLPAGKAVTL